MKPLNKEEVKSEIETIINTVKIGKLNDDKYTPRTAIDVLIEIREKILEVLDRYEPKPLSEDMNICNNKKLKCSLCGWEGLERELDDEDCETGNSYKPCCPNCKNENLSARTKKS
jgi:hypothetical protein